MNEIIEFKEITAELPALPEVPEVTAEYDDLVEAWNEQALEMDLFYESLSDSAMESQREIVEAREYAVEECADVAKECFTAEVIQEWGAMGLEERNQIVQEYAEGIGQAMGIDFKGIVWEEFPIENGAYVYGYNSGDGYVHLNVEMLANPAQLMSIVDTVAHEARHQLQNEAIENPSKFPIDEATIKEWTVGQAIYTLEAPSAYDPWGYTYNPMETDARFFGESMVREVTKHIINNA